MSRRTLIDKEALVLKDQIACLSDTPDGHSPAVREFLDIVCEIVLQAAGQSNVRTGRIEGSTLDGEVSKCER